MILDVIIITTGGLYCLLVNEIDSCIFQSNSECMVKHLAWPDKLITSHTLNNREQVPLQLFFFTMLSHCISSHDQQYVSDTAFVFHLFFIQSHCISSHDQQYVNCAAFVFLDHPASLHSIPWPWTGSEWHRISFSLPSSLISFWSHD